MAVRSTVTSSGPGVDVIQKAVADLLRMRLLVGIPADSEVVQPAQGGKQPPPLAVIGYIQEFGDDEKNIPSRPFLAPGVQDARAEIIKGLNSAALAAFSGKPEKVRAGFHAAGLAAQVSVKAKMNAGPFVPLSARTIEARARRRQPGTGKFANQASNRNARDFLKLQAQGTPDDVLHDAGFAKPLFDTGALYGSIVYVLKDGR